MAHSIHGGSLNATSQPIEVTLDWHELLVAGTIGLQRQLEALRAGKINRHGFTGPGWSEHIEGACGELAAAKVLNRYWNGSVNSFKDGGDVGELQIRTRSRHDYELLVRPDDADNNVFILVTGQSPTYRIVGWIRAGDAKRPEWLQAHGGRTPAYFVPHSALTGFTLKAA